jgi:hypothetical protein
LNKKTKRDYHINWELKVLKGVDSHEISTEVRQMIGELATKRRMIKNRLLKISKYQKEIDTWNDEIEDCKNREKELLLKLADEKKNITPNPIILFNQGRDKKYVHGKIWWYEKGFGVRRGDVGFKKKYDGGKKKYHRFHLGSMEWDLTDEQWKKECLRRFYIKMTS